MKTDRMSCRRRFAAMVIASMLLGAATARASVFGDVRGRVLDPQERPVEAARVVLQARASGYVRETTSGESGAFVLRAVPLGDYLLSVEAPGFSRAQRTVTVVSDSAPVLRVGLAIAPLAQTVDVAASPGLAGSDSPTPVTLVDRRRIEETPGADRANSLAMITSLTPGAYVIHDLLHMRGGHQVSWLVDGVPIPNTNISTSVGPQFDPKDVDYLEVQRGSYSAEFGDRTYGVFNVVPRTGFESDRELQVAASYGRFGQTDDQVRLGGHGRRLAYSLSVNGNRSGFGLATPTAGVLHDEARGLGGFASLIYALGGADQLRLAAGARGDRYEVPNDAEAQAAGIRDVERERDLFVNASWAHTWGKSLATVSPFYHFNRADYLGGGTGAPVVPTDRHGSHYAGGQAVLSTLTARHRLKAGAFGFHQRDDSFFGLRAADGTLGLAQDQRLHGHLEAAFVEDQFKPTPRVTLTAGVRYTHFGGSIREDDLSPRLGAAFRVPRLECVVRGFWGRYYQAPPLQTISGPVLDLALDEGFGFLPLRGEKDREWQVGVAIPVRGWSFDVDYFRNAARNFFDHDALGDSNIFFPLTIDRALIRGFEATARSPRLGGRAEVALAYSRQRAEGQGAVSGGLTDFAPPGEGTFFLDHDQRHTLNVGLSVQMPWRLFVAGALHYGSGFTDGEGPAHLPGHTLFDLCVGKALGPLELSVHALNVAGRRFLLDQSTTFGGTHFDDPRQVYARLRYRFRF